MGRFNVGDIVQWDRYPDTWWGPVTEVSDAGFSIRSQGLYKATGAFEWSDACSLVGEESVVEEDWT